MFWTTEFAENVADFEHSWNFKKFWNNVNLHLFLYFCFLNYQGQSGGDVQGVFFFHRASP